MIDQIHIGSLITLTDPETIESMMETGTGNFVDGLDLHVETIYEVESLDGSFTNYLYEFEEDINIFLLIKKAGKNLEYKVLFKVPEFPEGNRADVIENGIQFLFLAPESEEYVPAELELASYFTVNDGTRDENIEKVNEYFGKYIEIPEIENMEYPLFTQISEYTVDIVEEDTNPFLILMESGQLDEDGNPKPEGGWMEFFRGRSMKECDLEII